MWNTHFCIALGGIFDISFAEEVKIAKAAGFDGFFTEPIERTFGVFNAAETANQVAEIINHVHRLAVNLVIRRMREIHLNGAMNHRFKSGTVHSTIPNRIVHLSRPLVPNGGGRVIGPHDVELDTVVVLGL